MMQTSLAFGRQSRGEVWARLCDCSCFDVFSCSLCSTVSHYQAHGGQTHLRPPVQVALHFQVPCSADLVDMSIHSSGIAVAVCCSSVSNRKIDRPSTNVVQPQHGIARVQLAPVQEPSTGGDSKVTTTHHAQNCDVSICCCGLMLLFTTVFTTV